MWQQSAIDVTLICGIPQESILGPLLEVSNTKGDILFRKANILFFLYRLKYKYIW